MKKVAFLLVFSLGLAACSGVGVGSKTQITPPPHPFTATCTAPDGSTELIPDYFRPEFQTNYQAFMAAVVRHYSGNSSIGYIRIGLARGGETYPALGFENDPTGVCQAAFGGWGLSSASTNVWTNYLTQMLDYEKTLNSPIQLMVGLNAIYNDGGVPDAVAARAVQDGIGIGSQGLQSSDLTNYPDCTVDWCNLFNQYAGQVPLELQTLTQSDPSGGGQTGSLVPLLPFAVLHHATIMELYWEDWLTGFDSNFTGYDAAYATAIQTAAAAPTPVSMEVLFPPTSGAPYYTDVQTYLMTNPAVTGANFYVKWADVDLGPGTSPQYVFDSIDSELQPWISKGKKVNLVIWPVSDSSPNTATPQYVIDLLNSATGQN
jgi:hypothetical protein